MITSALEALILASTISESIDNIDVISVSDSSGEVFRKAYQNKDTVSTVERKYTFYLTESEGNTTITKISLYGNGATATLGDGTEMSSFTVSITKTNTQSLLINWTLIVEDISSYVNGGFPDSTYDSDINGGGA